jgi:hypothetical protein
MTQKYVLCLIWFFQSLLKKSDNNPNYNIFSITSYVEINLYSKNEAGKAILLEKKIASQTDLSAQPNYFRGFEHEVPLYALKFCFNNIS